MKRAIAEDFICELEQYLSYILTILKDEDDVILFDTRGEPIIPKEVMLTLPNRQDFIEIAEKESTPMSNGYMDTYPNRQQVFMANGYIAAVSLRRLIHNKPFQDFKYSKIQKVTDAGIRGRFAFYSNALVRRMKLYTSLEGEPSILDLIKQSPSNYSLLVKLERWIPDNNTNIRYQKQLYPILIIPKSGGVVATEYWSLQNAKTQDSRQKLTLEQISKKYTANKQAVFI